MNPTEKIHRNQVWETMNELDYTPQHFLNVKYTLNAAIDAIQHRDYDMVEKLNNVAMDLLDYYCDVFERNFQSAWKTTLNTADVADIASKPYSNVCDGDDQSPECKNARDDFWESDNVTNIQYTEEELNAMCDAATHTVLSKNKSWTAPIEEDNVTGDWYITFPDEVIEKVGWAENDTVEWVDNKDGSFSLKKVK